MYTLVISEFQCYTLILCVRLRADFPLHIGGSTNSPEQVSMLNAKVDIALSLSVISTAVWLVSVSVCILFGRKIINACCRREHDPIPDP